MTKFFVFCIIVYEYPLYKEEVMEFGLIAQVDQLEFNTQQQTQVINALKESRPVQEQPDIKEVIKQEQKEALSENKDIENEPSRFSSFNEFSLTNLNFGFNNKSHDFFVKAIRGESENQYPTDDVMRLKAYLMEANEAS